MRVNTPLLSRLAREARGTSTFVLPQEDVEGKVGQVYKRLVGPVLAGPELRVVDGAGNTVPGRVTDFLPAMLPDVFDGEQMILLGRYTGYRLLELRRFRDLTQSQGSNA